MSNRLTQSEIQKYVIWQNGKFMLNLPLFSTISLLNYANERVYPDTNSRIVIDPLLAQRFVPSSQLYAFPSGLERTFETTQFVYPNGNPSIDVILPYAKVYSLVSYIKRKNRERDKALGIQKKTP